MMLANMRKRESVSIIAKNLCFTTRRNYSYGRRWRYPLTYFRQPLDFSQFKISLFRRKLGLDYDKSNKRPDSVVNLLDTFGFPRPLISNITRHDGRILKDLDPAKDIMPKLNYLLYITRCESAVISIVFLNPGLLFTSLDSHLIPVFNLLKSVTGGYENAADFLKDNVHVVHESLTDSFSLNIRFLLEVGVPGSQIVKLMKDFQKVIIKPHDELRYAILKLKDLGFDFSTTCFYNCITPMTHLGDYGWESRCVLFKSFGFSDHEILSIFKRLPAFMTYDEELIAEKLDFFLYKLHWTPFMLSNLPAVLVYSIKKRTRPRCSVLQVLVSMNNTGEAYMLSKILMMTDDKFFEEFVAAHEDQVPKVMKAYQGKIRFKNYTFKQKEPVNLKPE